MRKSAVVFLSFLALLCLSGKSLVPQLNVHNIFPAKGTVFDIHNVWLVGCRAQDDEADEEVPPTVDPDIGASREALRTDDETVQK